MNAAKIYLSEEEQKLVLNKEWLYLKRGVIDKVFDFLGELHDDYQEIAKKYAESISFLPVDKAGKISRGENLKALPYLMMDYPAIFSKKKIIAVRTLFWWGNFFSVSLHLSGLATPVVNLESWLEYFKKRNFYISSGENQWNYDFTSESFEPFERERSAYIHQINDHGIFRVAAKCSLDNWENSRNELEKNFEDIIEFLSINYQAGEKDLLPGSPREDSRP